MKISLKDVRKEYRDADRTLAIIESLTYEFPESGSVAIVGRSGVGKSTLMHILGGLDTPSRGSILFGDTRISGLSPTELTQFRGSNIGFIFQFHHLLPEFSAVENVSMPLIISGVAEGEAEAMASAILDRVGLSTRLDHRPSQLSGGEQQRVAIARAVVTRPRVILADEPTGNLDFRTAREVQELLIDINKELSNVLIVVTHSNDLAESLDRRVEMLPGGNLKDL